MFALICKAALADLLALRAPGLHGGRLRAGDDGSESTGIGRSGPDSGSQSSQPMSSNTLKIGMYSAMIIDPTIPPRKAIISGSINAVSASVVASTSAS